MRFDLTQYTIHGSEDEIFNLGSGGLESSESEGMYGMDVYMVGDVTVSQYVQRLYWEDVRNISKKVVSSPVSDEVR